MTPRKPLDWALLPLRKYADFSGRAPRPEYWWFALVVFLVGIPANLMDSLIGLPVIGSLVSLGLLLPSAAVAVRRLHDLDHSGWWLLAPILAVILTLSFGLFGRLGSLTASRWAHAADTGWGHAVRDDRMAGHGVSAPVLLQTRHTRRQPLRP